MANIPKAPHFNDECRLSILGQTYHGTGWKCYFLDQDGMNHPHPLLTTAVPVPFQSLQILYPYPPHFICCMLICDWSLCENYMCLQNIYGN